MKTQSDLFNESSLVCDGYIERLINGTTKYDDLIVKLILFGGWASCVAWAECSRDRKIAREFISRAGHESEESAIRCARSFSRAKYVSSMYVKSWVENWSDEMSKERAVTDIVKDLDDQVFVMDERIERIVEALGRGGLIPLDREVLEQQLLTMRNYRMVLAERIERFKSAFNSITLSGKFDI